MISLTWYDILIVALLVFFTIRGAMKGVIFQIASLAGIVLCFVFANGIAQAAGPYVHLEPPLNHWVVLAASYLGFTFVCFMVARALNGWIEKHKLKEFDRHLGALLGFIKGLALALVLTFFVVTMSVNARAALKNSYTGRYSAIIMDRLHPILPDKLHDAVAEYIHLLDDPNLDLHAHDHDGLSSNDSPFGLPGAFPGIPGNATSPQYGTPATTPGSSLWGQLQTMFSAESQRVVSDALQKADPATRAQMEQSLGRLWNSVPSQDRAAIQQQIVQTGSNQLKQYLDWKLSNLTAPVQTPASTPASSGTSSGWGSLFGVSAPPSTPQTPQQPALQTDYGLPQPIPTMPNPGMSGIPANGTPAVNSSPATTGSLAAQRTTLMQEIAAAYSPLANMRQNIEVDITQRTSGLPENVVVAALQDWKADLAGTRPDPDPKTTAEHPVEVRLIHQLESSGYRIEQFSFEVQQRLRAAQAQGATFGNPL